MAPLNLQYSEQPLAVWDYNNLARLRDKVDLPICADESVFDDAIGHGASFDESFLENPLSVSL
jgi:hypothetical protein